MHKPSRAPLPLGSDHAQTVACRPRPGRLRDGTCMIAAREVRKGSADAEQVHHEDERLTGGDHRAGAAVAVRQVRRDDELAPATHLHAGDPAVPPGDHVAGAEGEGERLPAVPGGVELLTRREGDADVVHDRSAPRRGLLAVADRDVGDLELARRLAAREVDLGLVAHQLSFAGPCCATTSIATATLSLAGLPPCCAGSSSSTRLPTGTPTSWSNGLV